MSNQQPPQVEYHHEVVEARTVHEMHAPIMREQAEPRDGFEPVPSFFAPLFGMLIFWAGFFFATHYREFDHTALSEDPPVIPGAAEKEQSPIARGESVFKGNCASCHGNDGAGVSCPPLAKSEWITDRSPGVLVRILLHGLEGPISVAGKDYSPPSGMKVELTDQQIVNVAAYVRQAFGNQVKVPGDITLEFVKAVRDNTKEQKARYTPSKLLQDVPDDFLDAPLGTAAAAGANKK